MYTETEIVKIQNAHFSGRQTKIDAAFREVLSMFNCYKPINVKYVSELDGQLREFILHNPQRVHALSVLDKGR